MSYDLAAVLSESVRMPVEKLLKIDDYHSDAFKSYFKEIEEVFAL